MILPTLRLAAASLAGFVFLGGLTACDKAGRGDAAVAPPASVVMPTTPAAASSGSSTSGSMGDGGASSASATSATAAPTHRRHREYALRQRRDGDAGRQFQQRQRRAERADAGGERARADHRRRAAVAVRVVSRPGRDSAFDHHAAFGGQPAAERLARDGPLSAAGVTSTAESVPPEAESASPEVQPKAPLPSGLDFPVVGIGASAGGLSAVRTLLENLPAAPEMAFVVVLHLSPTHESNAAAILQIATRMTVAQVTGRMKIERNCVYVIPPTRDLAMDDGHLELAPSQRQRGRHVVVDLFFRTLADAHRERAVAVIFSGTGADGSSGIARVKEQGGVVFAQSPADAEFGDMPSSAIATGHVDIVLPAAEVATRLVELWKTAQAIDLPDPEAAAPQSPAAAEEALRDIMGMLHGRTGHDFTHYKRATVLRRIERRLQVNGLTGLPAYREFLAAQSGEARALLDDMLIGVTQFFRDRASFDTLAAQVVPQLFDADLADRPLRIWVAGCSTGEEAYSVGMLLGEHAARLPSPRHVSIYATDIDERAIAVAREGRYPESIAADVTPARLQAFFSKDVAGYRVKKEQRDRVIFALHNLLRDPPFSRIDLVCCRNLLIYLDRAAQHDVLQMFHYALRPGGYLMLGLSESVDATAKLFAPIDKGLRLYRAVPSVRSAGSFPPYSLAVALKSPAPSPAAASPAKAKVAESSTAGPLRSVAELHQRLLEAQSPPSVVVNAQYEILHVSARAGDYLHFSQGEPSHHVVQAVLPELRHELRACLFRALQSRGRIDAEPVRFVRDGKPVVVRMRAHAATHQDWAGEVVLISFDETADAKAPAGREAPSGDEDPRVAEIGGELQRREQQLQATVEQYESSVEDLRASNEELQAINEELRSATEELETSKEELQSTNEELVTVDHELKVKIDETSGINDDLKNLIASTEIATVFVDTDMRIKRFTPAAVSIFNIIASDVGRSLFDITHKLDYAALADDAQAVFESLRTSEREVSTSDGRLFLARLLPYRTGEDRIGGVVLAFVDVTGRRSAESSVRVGEERMKLIADTMTEYAIFTADLQGRLMSWSAGAARLFGYSEAEALTLQIDMLFTPEDRAAGVPATEMRLARETGRAPDERFHIRKDGSVFYASGVMTSLRDGGLTGYAKICRDLTPAHHAEAVREVELTSAQLDAAAAAAESEMKNVFLAVMSHELKHPLNLISVNAQLLMTMPEAQPLPQVLRAARTIQRTVQGQARIIDDLLDMSRSSAGKLALNRAPLLFTEAMQPSLNWALSEAKTKGIVLRTDEMDESLMVDGDPVRIEQIAWNLLSNAIKFGRSGGSIVARAVRDQGQALLEVSDTGRGIAPSFLPHVFEMFRQADAPTTRQEGGLGIGLALVKNLVELHGGRVEVASDGPGRGATFRVWLPLHAAPVVPAIAGAPVERMTPLAGKHVLLVDDTPDTLETFTYLLEADGAAVTAVGSAAAALAACETCRFDLVISDIGMPGMDGYDLIAELRSRPGTAEMPAIALTGYGRPQDIQQALTAGFTAHLDKPIDFVRMNRVIRDVIGGDAPLAAKTSSPPAES